VKEQRKEFESYCRISKRGEKGREGFFRGRIMVPPNNFVGPLKNAHITDLDTSREKKDESVKFLLGDWGGKTRKRCSGK